MSWDEQIHFGAAYEYSFRSNVIWTDSAQQIRYTDEANSYSIEERNDAIQYMNEHADYSSPKSVEVHGRIPDYKDYSCFAQAFMLLLGRKLGLSFATCYILGRLGNFISLYFYDVHGYSQYQNWKTNDGFNRSYAHSYVFILCVYL